MNFQLTEDEFNALDGTRGQLSLVAGLLTAKGSDDALFDASDLHDFLAAQTDTLRSALKAVDTRYKQVKSDERDGHALTVFDWKDIIEFTSGYSSLKGKHIDDLTLKLRKAAEVEAAMKFVLDAWVRVVTNDGELPLKSGETTQNFSIQLARGLPKVVPDVGLTEKEVARLYGVKRPRDVAKKIAALTRGRGGLQVKGKGSA